MKKSRYKYLLKKDQGSMIEFVYVMVTLVVVCIICIIMMNWYSNLDKKTKIEMIGREYILRMESVGYLGEEEQANLLNDLTEQGLIDISLTGTTKDHVNYGDKILLNISGSLEIRTFQLENWMHVAKDSKKIPVKIHKSSTAKN